MSEGRTGTLYVCTVNIIFWCSISLSSPLSFQLTAFISVKLSFDLYVSVCGVHDDPERLTQHIQQGLAGTVDRLTTLLSLTQVHFVFIFPSTCCISNDFRRTRKPCLSVLILFRLCCRWPPESCQLSRSVSGLLGQRGGAWHKRIEVTFRSVCHLISLFRFNPRALSPSDFPPSKTISMYFNMSHVMESVPSSWKSHTFQGWVDQRPSF